MIKVNNHKQKRLIKGLFKLKKNKVWSQMFEQLLLLVYLYYYITVLLYDQSINKILYAAK